MNAPSTPARVDPSRSGPTVLGLPASGQCVRDRLQDDRDQHGSRVWGVRRRGQPRARIEHRPTQPPDPFAISERGRAAGPLGIRG